MDEGWGRHSINRVRYRHHDESIFLYAFDLIELNGDDLRPDPLEGRKATLEIILAKAGAGIRFNEHMEGDGEGFPFRVDCHRRAHRARPIAGRAALGPRLCA